MARRKPPRAAGWHWHQRRAHVLPDGSKGCRMCMGQVTPPRRSFCGQPCVDRWLLLKGGSATCRGICEARDGGVCGLCGRDTRAIQARFDATREAARRADLEAVLAGKAGARHAAAVAPRGRSRAGRPAAGPALLDLAGRLGFRLEELAGPRSLWEAHHVVPLAEGGAYYEPSNLMTLCIPCHRHETAMFNARLRAARLAGP